MLEYKNVKLEKKNHVGILTINRPKALNALNTEVLTEIDQCIDEAQKEGMGAFLEKREPVFTLK